MPLKVYPLASLSKVRPGRKIEELRARGQMLNYLLVPRRGGGKDPAAGEVTEPSCRNRGKRRLTAC